MSQDTASPSCKYEVWKGKVTSKPSKLHMNELAFVSDVCPFTTHTVFLWDPDQANKGDDTHLSTHRNRVSSSVG